MKLFESLLYGGTSALMLTLNPGELPQGEQGISNKIASTREEYAHILYQQKPYPESVGIWFDHHDPEEFDCTIRWTPAQNQGEGDVQSTTARIIVRDEKDARAQMTNLAQKVCWMTLGPIDCPDGEIYKVEGICTPVYIC